MKQYASPHGIDPVLTIAQLQATVIYSRNQLYRMIRAGSFPKPIRLGPARVGWRQSAIAAWLSDRENASAAPVAT